MRIELVIQVSVFHQAEAMEAVFYFYAGNTMEVKICLS